MIKGSKDFRAVPAVQSFGSHIGQAFLAEEVVGPNFGESWFSIDKNADYDKTISQLEEVVDSYPGVFRELLTYLRERIDEVLAASTEPIVVRIFGDDLRALRHQANRREGRARGRAGPGRAEHGAPERRSRGGGRRKTSPPAGAMGSSRATSGGRSRRSCPSEEVGDIFRGGRAYDVHVWSTPKSRRNLTDIRNLPIDTPSGSRVRLADVADVRVRPTINIIRHEDSSRRIDVSAAVSEDSSLSEAVADVRDQLKDIEFPTGITRS